METMENITKVCSKCKVEKSYDNFFNDKRAKSGKQSSCRQCDSDRNKEWRNKNSEKVKENYSKWKIKNSEKLKQYNKQYQKEWYRINVEQVKERNKKNYQQNLCRIREQYKKYRQENSEKIKQSSKNYYQENSEKIKERQIKYRQNNTEKEKERGRKYRERNAEKIKERQKQYQNKRRNTDPLYRMIVNLRTRIYHYCRAIKLNKTTRTKEMLGIDLLGFQLYMESRFQVGMTWNNYGEWHVDHIKPLSLAITEQEVMELNHYTNLQPLWAVDNIKKSNKYEESH